MAAEWWALALSILVTTTMFQGQKVVGCHVVANFQLSTAWRNVSVSNLNLKPPL